MRTQRADRLTNITGFRKASFLAVITSLAPCVADFATAQNGGGEMSSEIPQVRMRDLGQIGEPVNPFVVHAGSINSEGDGAARADVARDLFGVDGSGVTVGVISDSFANNGGNQALADNAIVMGELPGANNPNGFKNAVSVLNDDFGTDEGRAMLEIIHDLAPGAMLKFHSAFNNGPSNGQTIANAINALVADGVDIIVDDVAVINQPFFQDGPAAQAVDSARAAGVSYFSSAGNSGTEAWAGAFNGVAGAMNNFDVNGNEGGDLALNVSLPAGGRITVEWDDPYPSVGAPALAADYDVGLWDFDTEQFVSTSVRDQAAGLDPFEIVSAPVAQPYGLVIQHFSGPTDKFFKAKIFSGQVADDDDTNTGTIDGHAAARGAVSVAAVFHGESGLDTVESFSSRGPTRILFDRAGNPLESQRDTALLTAPDGVATSVSGFAPFFGTSAAAPHAAAVAALVLDRANQLNVTLSVDQLHDILFETADDIETLGFDNLSGHGVVNAQAAVDRVRSLVPLQAGDADRNLKFDQFDLIRVQSAAKYLSSAQATWGEGDWDAAPGGTVMEPPTGNGLFDQDDITAALASATYLTGPYVATKPQSAQEETPPTVVYDTRTGELLVDPRQTTLTSINIQSTQGIFTGADARNFGGVFDLDSDHVIFKATFGGEFGSINFGPVAEPGLSTSLFVDDVSVHGSLSGGGSFERYELLAVPEPASCFLFLTSLARLMLVRARGRLSGLDVYGS